jgi:hypothetical protein
VRWSRRVARLMRGRAARPGVGSLSSSVQTVPLAPSKHPARRCVLCKRERDLLATRMINPELRPTNRVTTPAPSGGVIVRKSTAYVSASRPSARWAWAHTRLRTRRRQPVPSGVCAIGKGVSQWAGGGVATGLGIAFVCLTSACGQSTSSATLPTRLDATRGGSQPGSSTSR